MIRYTIEQRHLIHRGRSFHFVSYDGQPGNAGKGMAATAPAWYLMTEGKRREVMPHVPGQPEDVVDIALVAWLDENAFGGAAPSRSAPIARRRARGA